MPKKETDLKGINTSLGRNIKIREICLVVRTSDRLSEEAADHLFEWLKTSISQSPFIDAHAWHKVDELEPRQ